MSRTGAPTRPRKGSTYRVRLPDYCGDALAAAAAQQGVMLATFVRRYIPSVISLRELPGPEGGYDLYGQGDLDETALGEQVLEATVAAGFYYVMPEGSLFWGDEGSTILADTVSGTAEDVARGARALAPPVALIFVALAIILVFR